jgi:hypothetical protein
MSRTRNTNGVEEECIDDTDGKTRRKESLGRARRRWLGNIKSDLGKIVWDGMDWNELAQDRDQWRAIVGAVMNLRVP